MKPLFPLGHLVATPAALELMDHHAINSQELIRRHQSGDWGNLDPEDQRRNTEALTNGARIFSSYNITPHEKIWCITESDRSSTCLLTPSDY